MSAPSSPTPAPGGHHNVSVDAQGRKRWHIGTLTYTTGGLVILFALLLMGDFSWSLRDRSVGPMANWYINSLVVPASSGLSDHLTSQKVNWALDASNTIQLSPQATVAGQNLKSSTVTVHYGKADGGTNEKAWESHKAAGNAKTGSSSFNLSGLQPNTAYHYRVQITLPQGVLWSQSEGTFTTSDKAKVSSVWFAIFFSTIPAIIGFLLVPVISVKSDRHRGKRGRRIPYLLVITPIAAVGMVGIALTPWFTNLLANGAANHSGLGGFLAGYFGPIPSALFAVAIFSFFWLIFEVASIASQPVFTGLINDTVPRAVIGRFYGLFRAISLIDGMIFNYWLMGMVPTHFAVILVSIGVFYGIAFQIVCLNIKEGKYPDPDATPSTAGANSVLTRRAPGRGFFRGIGDYLKECFSNPFYLALFFMLMTAGITFLPVNLFSMRYAEAIELDMKTYGHVIAYSYLVSMGLAYFLGWLADRFHPLRMAMVAMTLYVLVSIWGSLFATNTWNFLVAFFLHTVLSGTYFTGAATLTQRLFPHSKFAQFTSAAALLGALAGIFTGPAIGKIIESTGNEYRHTFTAAAILGTVALLLAAYVYYRFNKLGGTKHYVAPGENEIEPEDEAEEAPKKA